MLSWRVALLPYLGIDWLYKEFHLDEPWDGPHNRELLARIPAVYRTPGVQGEGKTCYLAPSGVGTMFAERKGLSVERLGAGAGKTIAVIEADGDRAVPWTQPEDLRFIPARPLAGMGTLREGNFLSLFADGVVHRLSTNLEPELARAMFAPSPRKPLDPAQLDTSHPAGRHGRRRARNDLHGTGGVCEGQRQGGSNDLEADVVVRAGDDVLETMHWCQGLRRPMFLIPLGTAIQAANPAAAGCRPAESPLPGAP